MLGLGLGLSLGLKVLFGIDLGLKAQVLGFAPQGFGLALALYFVALLTSLGEVENDEVISVVTPKFEFRCWVCEAL